MGKDFASMGLRTAQQGSRTISVLESLPDQGDWHRSLDRPADGVFVATDLRLRLELLGNGTTTKPLGEGRYELSAGEKKIVIHTLPGTFAGRDVDWSLADGADDGAVDGAVADGATHLDGVCYVGPQQRFDFRSGIDVMLSFGIELLDAVEPPTEEKPLVTRERSGQVKAQWNATTGARLKIETIGRE